MLVGGNDFFLPLCADNERSGFMRVYYGVCVFPRHAAPLCNSLAKQVSWEFHVVLNI
jgi:hypothetical protein